MPVIMLLAAVLAAEEVHFVLVGSAGLHLHGEQIGVRDIDAVPAPGRENLGRLHSVLADLSMDGRVPAVRSLATAHVMWPQHQVALPSTEHSSSAKRQPS